MKTLITTFAIGAVIGSLPPTHSLAESAQSQKDSAPNWQEQNAYTLGVQAYLYCFPWSYMTEARWTRTEPVDRQANRFDQCENWRMQAI